MAEQTQLVKRITLDDVGTRGEHIVHLRDNWQIAADSLELRNKWLTVDEKQLLTDLRVVLEFMDNHLTKDFIDVERISRYV